MIRNSKNTKQKHTQESCSILNYRNAVYQGQINVLNSLRQGRGILYISNSHHFIACNHFADNKINDLALFYHGHSRYHYGNWHQNKLDGVGIFRIEQILIITKHNKGVIAKGGTIVIIFQRYNIGIIIQVIGENNWSIKSQKQIICNQHLQDLIKQCNFKYGEINHSLVQFLNFKMNEKEPNSMRLRLINNKFYRFGFDKGLAIVFDDSFKIISSGIHYKNDLIDLGVNYHPQLSENIIQEGIFDGQNTYVFNQVNKPVQKIEKMYYRSHLSSFNFQNQYFIDPSVEYFAYFDHLLNSQSIKQLFSNQILNSPKQNDSYLRIIDESKEPYELTNKYQKLTFKQFQIPTFKKPQRQMFLEQKQQTKNYENIHELDIIRLNRISQVNSKQFQKLSQKNRLDIIKKQLIFNVNSRTFPAKDQQIQNQNKVSSKKQPRIINMSRVSSKNKFQLKNNIVPDNNGNENKIEQEYRLPNVEQHIDIILQASTPKEEKSKSRTKRKIFQQNKSIKRDYSPDTQISPFKSRMKSRIFGRNYDQSRSRSRSKSSKRIFTNPKMPITLSALNSKDQNYMSPHHHLKASKQMSSDNKIDYPVTFSYSPIKSDKKFDSQVQEQELKQLRVFNKSKINAKQNVINKEQKNYQIKRANHVYRNSIKEKYNQYDYEPINIKDSGNMPYVNSNIKSLSRSKSSNRLATANNQQFQCTKKVIGETSPLKNKQKMGGYLNQKQPIKSITKFSDFKKNYF